MPKKKDETKTTIVSTDGATKVKSVEDVKKETKKAHPLMTAKHVGHHNVIAVIDARDDITEEQKLAIKENLK